MLLLSAVWLRPGAKCELLLFWLTRVSGERGAGTCEESGGKALIGWVGVVGKWFGNVFFDESLVAWSFDASEFGVFDDGGRAFGSCLIY